MEELKVSIETIGRLEQQLMRKEEQIKILHDQSKIIRLETIIGLFFLIN